MNSFSKALIVTSLQYGLLCSAHADTLYRLPITWSERGYNIAVEIAGQPAVCIVDSGATNVMIGKSLANRIPAGAVKVIDKSSSIDASGGVTDVFVVQTDISIGDTHKKQVEALAPVKSGPWDCLLGLSWLRQFKSFAFVKEHEDKPAILLVRE